MPYTEMLEVDWGDLSDIAAGKVAVSEIFRSRDDEIVRTAAVQVVAPKGGLNHLRDIDWSCSWW